ncbi:MAG: glycoside hydrolase [Bacteroidetes bacterium GWD2_45_23]|nr:MAG: glycoside hydrolase [Bacteroidetes bacterium GWC2_46_850]OFX73836.1 MAG: glycoside hydrolase [Bacteroidetes bacterium GWC1_47_7]OFX85131.1 MAG: glycoside hydrolase [Bacteroidetes bacterium GWD2_45_23]HBB00416.1 glycoside hydrolase family 2 [Porphyromonadaceae bacterium]HCC18385.1 glycoside hydrolase family 2 [Porphyromonadaceae bacterium]
MRKRKLSIVILLVMFVAPSLRAQVSFGSPEKINDNWKFLLNDVPDGQSVTLNDTRWRSVSLPHDWSVKGQLSPTLASCTGYLPGGIGWYRKTINVPAAKEGEKVYLYFEGIYNRSEVFLNGESLGKRPSGYISFMFDATPYIKYGEENVIAVRVDHSQSADSRWYTGSGIYRDVWVVYANPVHIAQWGVYAHPEEVKNGYRLNVEVDILNEEETHTSLTILNELYTPEGKLIAKDAKKLVTKPGSENKLKTTLKVNKPTLWSLTTPYLYELKTTVLKGKEIVDQTSTRTGFRSYTFDPDKGFALNGEWMKVKGVCIHHDAGVLGAAVPRDVWRRRLQTLKEIGVNAIRTSHNPQATDLYDLCDEMGMLVLNEMYDEWVFPKRKWLEGWNVGTPGFQGSYDIFKEWSEIDLADLVRRDRNHVSVFAWSIGNEVDYPNDPYSHPVLGGEKAGFTQASYGGYNPDAPDAMELGDIAKRLVKVVKTYDSTRPVTAGLAGVAMSNETAYPGALDIAGYNYTEDKYDSDHEKYPNRVIYGSENRHDMAAWKATRDKEHVFGQFLWTGIDYLGESGRWPTRGFYSGLLDFGGFIKPRGYFRQSLWSDKPMAYMGTYPTPGRGARSQSGDVLSQTETGNQSNYVERVPSMDAWPIWNYREGQSIRVVCYSNAEKAKLLLNGTVVGETQEYDDQTGIIFWDIPYKAGKLEVVGLDKENNIVSGYTIHSSHRPHALKVVQTEKQIDKENGLAHVVVQVVDENGIPVRLADNEVTCRVSGPAKLLGLEASNNSDMSDYTDNRHRVFHGRILAYVQATGEEGEIKINFTSPWLEPAEVILLAE